MIVGASGDPGGYDHDWTVVLDDWIDGTSTHPDEVLTLLRHKTPVTWARCTAWTAAQWLRSRPAELDGELLRYDRLKPAEEVRLPAETPDVLLRPDLTGA
ncbi:hypothetical protein AB0F52_38600 [Amycolatopsis sp. NPDC024027]|uniref:hypothetical protein n=1 Tax=Amycolatopsis sp. NPDC024027 TaxID=3154327 RepID=UPI0033D31685